MAKKRQKGFLTAFSIIFILIFALGILTHFLPSVEFVGDAIVNGSGVQGATLSQILLSPILGFETKNQRYDYDAKYTDGMTTFIMPADFNDNMTKELQDIAVQSFVACEWTGLARGEFLGYNNTPYVLEINTNPGMTDLSDLPAQANSMGIDYKNLVELILKTSEF